MGRPREFDERQALEQAMHVFWAKGYEAASLCDLIEAMGLSKSSFYDTFGGKNDLFIATLDWYRDTVVANFTGKLRARTGELGSARAAINEVFDMVVEAAAGGAGPRGCYLGNCAVEVSGTDPVAAARIRAGLSATENAFHDAVLSGQDQGEIAAKNDPRALAKSLTSSLNGLRVMAKINPEEAGLRDIARLALSVLD
jgi:TetR/AcrR family transcriptional regulator, transcriptional repressor for nem operon